MSDADKVLGQIDADKVLDAIDADKVLDQIEEDKAVKGITARVLMDQVIGDTLYRCDDLIRFKGKTHKNLIGSGLIDTDPGAVEYCQTLLGKKIIQIDAKK